MKKLILLTAVMALALVPALRAGDDKAKDQPACCAAGKADAKAKDKSACCAATKADCGSCPMSAKKSKEAAKAAKAQAKADKKAAAAEKKAAKKKA